ncbi:MAG: fibronectin type III domain-containing protein [Nitrospirota bacterium]
MSDLTNRRFCFTQTRCTEAARIPLHLTTIVACILLTIMPLLTGCGGGDGETGSAPSAEPAGATASLAWSPIQDPSVIAYFVHYGRHSPGQPGSCTYEHSMHAASHSATITNLEPNTTYYFAVSAYNGLESPCSSEVSIVMDSLPV